MSIHICPNCQQRYSIAYGNTDFVHDCSSNDATIDNESVLVVGSWEDYTGSATVQSAQISVAGMVNTELGTEAGIRGAKVSEYDNRGKAKDVYRTRKHFEHINLGGNE